MEKITVVIPVSPNTHDIDALDSIKNQKIAVKTLIERGKNTSRNRNLGAKKAKTTLVAFVNAHTILSNNWSREVLSFFKKYPSVDIVGGPQLTREKEGIFARASGYALSSFGGGIAGKRYKKDKFSLDADEFSITSANIICKKSVFSTVEFDEKVYPGEDPKFINDAKAVGLKVAYTPDIIAYNKRRTNFFSLSKQIYAYGRRRLSLGKKISLKNAFFALPSLFLLYLVTLPLSSKVIPFASLPLLLYLALDIFFSAYEGIKNKDFASMALMPLIIPTIHLSYGLGFIIGIFKND